MILYFEMNANHTLPPQDGNPAVCKTSSAGVAHTPPAVTLLLRNDRALVG